MSHTESMTMQFTHKSNPLKLALTMGDPAGIGPEVLLKALKHPLVATVELTIFGDRTAFWQTYQAIEHSRGTAFVQQHLANPDSLMIETVASAAGVVLGQESTASGQASFAALKAATERTVAGEFAGIVTGPIAKSAWKRAGHLYPGQTEFLAEQARVKRYGMFFVATSPITDWQLRVLLATTHIPLQAVPSTLTPELLTLKLDLLLETLQTSFGIAQPRVAIAGLNPHSGEQGQLGTEEIDGLIPWLETMRDRYPQAKLEGPIPPDTMWVKPGQAWFGSNLDRGQPHDAYLALYHDQGLIPTKLMAFDRAVNTTIGLPFVRTSPDHGTAFDIAGQGMTDATSMTAAIALACQLAEQRVQVELPSPASV
jgi:4-hydroxythreonine-4-phosphate dehydrogenase